MWFNVENFTDPDGLSLARDANVTSMIPRLIPKESQANALKGFAIFFGTVLVLIAITYCTVSIYLGRSLIHLWSAVNFLQLASHMPLFTVLFPANIAYFLSYFVDFVTFEIFPKDSLPSRFNFEY